MRLIIDHDEVVGFYLLVYPLDSNKSIADHLYGSLEKAFLEADKLYGVVRGDWD